MKQIIKTILLLTLSLQSQYTFSQTLESFFVDKGVRNLCEAAHPSNDYESGTYDIQARYIDISVKSYDNFFGRYVNTDVRVVKGAGGLFFSDLIVLGDEDKTVPTFNAFGFQSELMRSCFEAIDQETYNKASNSVRELFNTDVKNWTGKMWAILAINLSYYEYMITGK